MRRNVIRKSQYLDNATETPICIHVGNAGGTDTVMIWRAFIITIPSKSFMSVTLPNHDERSMRKPYHYNSG